MRSQLLTSSVALVACSLAVSACDNSAPSTEEEVVTDLNAMENAADQDPYAENAAANGVGAGSVGE